MKKIIFSLRVLSAKSTFAGLFWLSLSCGSDRSANQKGGPGEGRLKAAFSEASQKNGIPQRLLLAVAYLESHMNARKAAALDMGHNLALVQGHETAFGLSRATLGLSAGPDGDDLAAQVEAYARWLALGTRGLALNSQARSGGDTFQWIWEIAQRHRSGSEMRKNIRIFFAKELMQILNSGFSWQNLETGETLRLEKESPALMVQDLSPKFQSSMKLFTRKAQVPSALFFQLGENDPSLGVRETQGPKGIEILHCPFSLSSCLEIQQNLAQNSNPQNRLAAHYLISSEASINELPLQLAMHENPLYRPDSSDPSPVRIMLTGYSGVLEDGRRGQLKPTWFSKWQLERMSELVTDICNRLSAEYGANDEDSCSQKGLGVRFQSQKQGDLFHWGDVLDFDKTLFHAYINPKEPLPGLTSFSFSKDDSTYEAGTPIRFDLNFQSTVQRVELERLSRCPNQETVWLPLSQNEVRSQSKIQFETHLWDAGPNHDGSHFLKAKVYGKKGQLLGWDITQIQIAKYEDDKDSAMIPSNCDALEK
ncbi:MAG: hypothetical protein KA436_06005 [Oligoflexales bacterium]|nr:hypothetical protein [Oligoflexales bacterium]